MIKLLRDTQNTVCTLGAFFDGAERLCETLELPWHENQHNISCIPAATYDVKYLFSPKHNRNLFWIMEVPGRGAVEIHIGNTAADTLGCVLVGSERDGDSISKSRLAFDAFMKHFADVTLFSLEIVDSFNGGAQ